MKKNIMAALLAGAGVLGTYNEAEAAEAPRLTAVFNDNSGIHNQKVTKLTNELLSENEANKAFEPYRSNIEAALQVLQEHQGDGWERVHKNKWNNMKLGNIAYAVEWFPKSKWGKRAPEEVAEFIDALGPLKNVTSAADLKKTQDAEPETKKPEVKKSEEAKPTPATVTKEFDSKAKTLTDKVHEILKPHLAIREGKRLDVYPDPVKGDKYPTVGIGHLVKKADGLKIGDKITEAQCDAFYKKDTDKAVKAAIEQATTLGVQDNVKFVAALASVNFQLGTKWNSIHKTAWKQMTEGKYEEAAVSITKGTGKNGNSKWLDQTPTRVEDFQKALSQLAKDVAEPTPEQPENEQQGPVAPGV